MKAPSPVTGMRLPDFEVPVTHRLIVMGAASSRDWQPQHNDPAWAAAAGLPNIIMNNYTQAGLIGRYVTDWTGARGRIGRLRFSMRRPLCPGDKAIFRGVVADVMDGSSGLIWAMLDVNIWSGDEAATRASVKVALPERHAAHSPWRCPPDEWRP